MGQVVPDTTFGIEIPNKDQNISKKAHRRTTSGAIRRITARGDSGPIDMSNMPFLPPSLQWKGRSSITSRQFLAKRDARVASKGKYGVTYNQGSMNIMYWVLYIGLDHFGAHNLSPILKIMV